MRARPFTDDLATRIRFARRFTASDWDEPIAFAPPEEAPPQRIRITCFEELPTEYTRKLEDIMSAEHASNPLPFTIPGTRLEDAEIIEA